MASAENGRVSPRESVGYLNDSDIQYIVAEAEDIKEIKTDEAKVEVKYKDPRKVEYEAGSSIEKYTISKIKRIEEKAHKDQMQIMSEASSIEDLSDVYGTKGERMKIISGEDWYLIYSEEEDEIHIHDLARGKTRFEDEEIVASKEILEGIDKIIETSIGTGKEIAADMREDTSYLLVLRMKERGLIEQIGDDVAFEYGDEYDQRKITEEEQKEMLARSAKIREIGAKENGTTMHRFRFKPTEKYKARLRKRNINNGEGEIE